MTDIGERLTAEHADSTRQQLLDLCHDAADEIERLRPFEDERIRQRFGEAKKEIELMSETTRVAVLRIENERLLLENWQLKGALGYPVPADIPEGFFFCGPCEARRGKAATPEAIKQYARKDDWDHAANAPIDRGKDDHD